MLSGHSVAVTSYYSTSAGHYHRSYNNKSTFVTVGLNMKVLCLREDCALFTGGVTVIKQQETEGEMQV